jgi:protein TonB
MQPEKILKSDVLDILFENRNKEYGAYQLRRDYNSRVKKSIAIAFSLVAVIISFSFFKKSPKIIDPSPFTDSVFTIKSVIPPDHPKAEQKQMKSNIATKVQAKNIASATIPDKIRIVPDQDATQNLIKVNEALEKNISDVNTKGDLNSGLQNTNNGSGGTGTGNGKSHSDDPDPNIPLATTDVPPKFPGGLGALSAFLQKNLVEPEGMDEDEKVQVQVQFIVSYDGSVSGYSIVKSGGEDFDNEVMRVLKKMPQWIPGQYHGKAVSSYFIVPVTFEVRTD